MVRDFESGSLDARRGSLKIELAILGMWWSKFDLRLFTLLGAIEAMRFVWVAMVTWADYQIKTTNYFL